MYVSDISDGMVGAVAERLACYASCRVFGSRKEQIFVWPTDLCFGCGCLCT